MSSTPWISSLRAENLAGHYELVRSDYPTALMTRRTFALEAERILEARAVAPSFIGCGRPYRWSTRPPC